MDAYNINFSNLFIALMAILALSSCGGGATGKTSDISGEGSQQRPFVFKVYLNQAVDNPQHKYTFTPKPNSHYNIDCNSDGVIEASNQTNVYICKYSTANPNGYKITVSGSLSGFMHVPTNYAREQGGNAEPYNKEVSKLEILQWGSTKWVDLSSAFAFINQPIIAANDIPNLSKTHSLSNMFNRSYLFNSDISQWDVSKVTDMSFMFNKAWSFNQNIGNWNVGNVTNMRYMFYGTSAFNQDIGIWNVNKVTDMSKMFANARSFNQDIGNWDVSKVTNMSKMFTSARTFNQRIGSWSVGHVTDMSFMFANASTFNQDIGHWNVSQVIDTHQMFANARKFNQYLGNWDVSNIINMSAMFAGASAFNQAIDNWNVSKVTNMSYMFSYSSLFDQNLGNWDVSNVVNMRDMLTGVELSTENYANLLTAWSALNVKHNVFFNGGNSKYLLGSSAHIGRNTLKSKGWKIVDGGAL